MSKFTFIKLSILSAIIALSGCATTSEGVNDPFENYNRTMYSINDTLDKAIIKPAAQGYDAVLPDAIERGVSNFFSNLNEITVILNDLLQLKFGQAIDDTGRFLLNSTVGFAGVFDVAGHAGYESNDEDFGQTLGVWGVEQGAYIVLPFFGPSTTRDTFGLVGDILTDPVTYVDDAGARNALTVLKVVDARANLLGVEKVLEEAAEDKYSYVRDAYLQRRENLVYDGNPPEEDFDVFSD